MKNKREYGQYFTQENPFNHSLFKEWISIAVCEKQEIVLEPFAGANNILKLINESGYNFQWTCYDIDPPIENVFPKYQVEYRDTIADFPSGYRICITNCPYLGKSSARRRKIDYHWEEDDLYKVCLNRMLDNCEYVAAIIPESFITANIHRDRLWGVISLTCKMFYDTDCPVCLAMFTPYSTNETKVYSMDVYLGSLEDLSKFDVPNTINQAKWVFNDKNGSIGVKTIDSQKKADCSFFGGELIDPETIKVSSRSFTRISGLPENIDKNNFFDICNNILKEYREHTKDVLMTSFKGLRADGKYRRRLDFKTVRNIMNQALIEINKQTKRW